MSKVAIYTAIYGFHDTLKPTIEIPGADWFCFHDGSANRSASELPPYNSPLVQNGWQLRRLRGRFAHPRMSAKWIRMNPDLLLPEYNTTIWIDASFTITSPDFVKWIQESLEVSEHGFTLFRHPERSNIYEECAASEMMSKYAGEPMREQVEYYRQQGLPNDHPLWATGIMGRRNTPLMTTLNQRWMNENIRWSWQDQLSLPYVLWGHAHKYGYMRDHFVPAPLKGNIYDHPMFSRVWAGPNR